MSRPRPDYEMLWKESEKRRENLKTVSERMATYAEERQRHKEETELIHRRIVDVEEELKLYNKIKADNERLKAENRALVRVVNKLNNMSQIKMA